MKSRLGLAALVFVLPASLALVAATASPRALPSARPVVDGALDEAMNKLQAGLQRVGKALDKKDAPAALGMVMEMQAAAASAKTETPPKAEVLTEPAKKAEFVNGYRKQMIELQKALLDLELALLDGKTDEAKKIYDERVKAAKKSGHDTYKD